MGNPYMNRQLIEKLIALWERGDLDKFNKAMAQAKYQFIIGANNRGRLDTFDKQVLTLLDKGYPEAAGMEKDRFLWYVNPLRDEFKIGDLIVIPERIVSIPKQMSMVKLNGRTGYTRLNLGALRQADGVETSNVPYLIRDVEDGAAMRNTSPDNCVKQFKEQGRFEHVTEEGIAIVTHKPETLNDHYIDLPGSRYYSDYVPCLWLNYDRPHLDSNRADNVYWKWGSASCGSRIRA